jgi:uncharacterized coiled-coil DUF342 family protein
MYTNGEDQLHNVESLGWDDLVTMKRKLSTQIKDLTNTLMDIDNNQFRILNNNMREQKNNLNNLMQHSKQIRIKIQDQNSKLLSISEKVSQSKNFLSTMEYRTPVEKEDELLQTIQDNQNLLDQKSYKSEREKNEILTLAKDASMKLEAIKVITTVKDQLSKLYTESNDINKSLKELYEQQRLTEVKGAEADDMLYKLMNSKRILSSDHERFLMEYDKTISQLDIINARLNVMAEMRERQRQEYGHGLPSDALFRVKETAKKKLESGSKLSFDELKLLYGEKDQ